ncbi:MAG: hypothetical protein MZV64_23365 [Ignavibacteriales bacterium]|nr:hypothetical protein [Ignavibacteriales bacterium]
MTCSSLVNLPNNSLAYLTPSLKCIFVEIDILKPRATAERISHSSSKHRQDALAMIGGVIRISSSAFSDAIDAVVRDNHEYPAFM